MRILFVAMVLLFGSISSFADLKLVTADFVFSELNVNYDTDWVGETDSGLECVWSFDDFSYFPDSGAYIVSYLVDGAHRDQRIGRLGEDAVFWKTVLDDGTVQFLEEIGPATPTSYPQVYRIKRLGDGKVRLEMRNGEQDLGAHCIVEEA
ncbi:MAG: hypothetical protein AAF202_11120 [Pseudomonadota bacterium]